MGNEWTKPILRWAGSKRKLLPTLMAVMPADFERYVEPFAGSACLFFALHPRSAILGDVNSELIEMYGVLRRHPRKLARAVRQIPGKKSNYYRIRSLDSNQLNPLERATRFVYLNRYCFNGVYRTNRGGLFNVPFGSHQGAAPSEVDFFRCSYALRAASLFSGDFEECIQAVGRGDFVYLDPPYSSTARPRFGEYGYQSFQPIDISRLKVALKSLDKAGAKFLLSYSDDLLHRESFSDWDVKVIRVRRHVAGFSRHRKVVAELLVSNYEFDINTEGAR